MMASSSLSVKAVTSLHLFEITGSGAFCGTCSSSSSSTASSVVGSISSLGGAWSGVGCATVSVGSSPVASPLLLLLALPFPLIHLVK